MNKPPAFQFYADDFLGGVITMTNQERGLYITLLCIQWSRGYITEDDAKRLGDGMATLSLEHVISKFELSENGQRKNIRLEKERSKQLEYRENQAKQGKIGAIARWRRHGDPINSPMAKNGSPSPSPSPYPIKPTKLPTKPKKLSTSESEAASRLERVLGVGWINDAGKWINRVKTQPSKAERVIAEVECAAKEGRIIASPAAFAEDTWKRFA